MRWPIGSYRVLYNDFGFIDVKESLSRDILIQSANIVSLKKWRGVVAYDDRLAHELDAIVSRVRLGY